MTPGIISQAKDFLNRCSSQTEIFCLAWVTIMGYLRMATHPAIFKSPLSPEEAMQNIETLVQRPQVRLLSEEQGFLDIYRNATRGLAVRGNLVPDAHLASILRKHSIDTLYSNDSDFRKFDYSNTFLISGILYLCRRFRKPGTNADGRRFRKAGALEGDSGNPDCPSAPTMN
ncbi:MAG: hypothetical protein HY717_03705 [Planctomycetes bacterium]|nr:hypothetical protein [Planctomycetota bacterium]